MAKEILVHTLWKASPPRSLCILRGCTNDGIETLVARAEKPTGILLWEVRIPEASPKTYFTRALAAHAYIREIHYREFDLLDPHTGNLLQISAQDCATVLHYASMFALEAAKPRRENSSGCENPA